MTAPLPISVVILTRNEVDRVPRALEGLDVFESVIVVDSLSQDGTLEAARAKWLGMGADLSRLKLLSRSWPGFQAARNESLQWVHSSSWVLWLDADEQLSPRLLNWFQSREWEELSFDTVIQFPRQSFFMGKKIKHGGWYPDKKRRMAHASMAHWKSGPRQSDVHEDLETRGGRAKVYNAEAELLHWPFRDVAEQRATNERYSTLLAEGVAKDWRQKGGSAPSKFFIFLKTCVKFAENYIFKLGILDGRAGLQIALGSAQSMKWRLLKARRLLLEEK